MSASGAILRRLQQAGMPHVNFHDLRHSCASILLSLGVDLYTIGRILGHSSVQTTQRYAHLQVDAQRAALDKLSKLVESSDNAEIKKEGIAPEIAPDTKKPAS